MLLFNLVSDGHVINDNLCTQQLQRVFDALIVSNQYTSIENAPSYSIAVLYHTLPIWSSTNLRKLRGGKYCLTMSRVQTLHHHITTFYKPWVISSTDKGSKIWMKLKIYLSLNQPNDKRVELSFCHNNGNILQSMMGYSLMNKRFCLNY